MMRQEERVGNERGHDRAADHCGDQQRVLRLSHDAVRQPEERRDAAEGKTRRHEQRRIEPLANGRLEAPSHGEHAEEFGHHLGPEQYQEGERRRDERGDRHERTGANEIERRQQPEGHRAQPPHQCMTLAHGAGKHHAQYIGGQDRFAVRPCRERAKAEERQKKKRQQRGREREPQPQCGKGINIGHRRDPLRVSGRLRSCRILRARERRRY